MHRAAVLALVLLAGCGSMSMPGWPKRAPESAASANAWARPGADPKTVAAAYDACLAGTDTSTRNDFDIDQDIAATRGADLQRSAPLRALTRQAHDTNRDRAAAILNACMQAKGFKPAR